MPRKKHVRLIGSDPSVVDDSTWPGLTPEELRPGLGADQARLSELGYLADLCFWPGR